MSKTKTTPGKEESLLLKEPVHIVNEIMGLTNAFVSQSDKTMGAILYLGASQRYAINFLHKGFKSAELEELFDSDAGTFEGIKLLWVDAHYHVNLVQFRHNAETTPEG